jgi:hypothetical protein
MSRESENWRRNFPNEVPQRTGLAPSLTLWLIGGAEYVALNRLLNFGVKPPEVTLEEMQWERMLALGCPRSPFVANQQTLIVR